MSEQNPPNDPYDLTRFLDAQQDAYSQALSELKQGKKQSHWIWFIFPQVEGLGSSPTAQHFAIKSKAEAKAYLDHPVLGSRLVECSQALLTVQGRSISEIMGHPDDLKLMSSMTLFSEISDDQNSVFEQVLEKYYQGKKDGKTIDFLHNR